MTTETHTTPPPPPFLSAAELASRRSIHELSVSELLPRVRAFARYGRTGDGGVSDRVLLRCVEHALALSDRGYRVRGYRIAPTGDAHAVLCGLYAILSSPDFADYEDAVDRPGLVDELLQALDTPCCPFCDTRRAPYPAVPGWSVARCECEAQDGA